MTFTLTPPPPILICGITVGPSRQYHWHIVCGDCVAGFGDVGNVVAVSNAVPNQLRSSCCFCPQQADRQILLVRDREHREVET